MADSTVSDFIHAASTAVGQPPPSTDQPMVPFQTALKLTAQQEKDMLDYAFKRLRELENEAGRDQTLQATWWANLQPTPNQAAAAQGFLQASTFLGKRSRYDATFENDVSWRPWTMGVDNIFQSSNLVVPLSRRICRQMIAKAKENFLGSDPWFSVDPTPGTATLVDDEQAERIERFTQFKLRESNTKDNHARAIQRALILGECPVKTTYVVRDQIFNAEAQVLHSVDDQPLRAADGSHITPDDQWNEVNDSLGNPTKVLARDGQTVMPDAPIWKNITLNRRQVLFEGARSEPIYFKDWLCPLTAASVQEADCCAHLYDKNVAEFVGLMVKRGMVGDDNNSRIQTAQRMVAMLQKLDNNSSAPKSASTQAIRPNENYTPVPSSPDAAGPVAEFAEFYMWYDANGDGVPENIMLIADRKNQIPIFYDHVANVTTDGLRPIEIIRINPIEGRWYGMGIIELFESYQIVTDLLVNRWNFSQSRSGRVDLWTPTNTLEGDRDQNLKMNWGGTYTKKPGMKAEDVLETVYLNDTKFEAIHEMIQFFMQLAMNESGVTNANDDQAAGMQSAKLATGILEVKKSGDELFQPIIADLKGPLERLLNREISVTLANLNPEEVFTYLDGDTMQIDKLTPQDVRGLKYKATISLTTHKNQQTLQQSATATQLVTEFYGHPPDIQERLAFFYKKQIRALCPDVDPDQVIVPQQPNPNPVPPMDATKSSLAVSVKWEQLPPEVQQQMMDKLGVKEGVLPFKAATAAALEADAKASAGPDGAKKPAAKPAKMLQRPRRSTGVNTPFEAQLGQKHSQPKGISAA